MTAACRARLMTARCQTIWMGGKRAIICPEGTIRKLASFRVNVPIRPSTMPRILSTLFSLLLLTSDAVANLGDLPRPAGIEPQIRFWTRIYSEIDRAGGLLHDSTHMDVVYEAIRLPEGHSARAHERHVERAKERYVAILHKLAKGKRSQLSDDEARVLAMWPEGVSNATLKGAASRIRFQLGQADRFREGLERAGEWMPHIRNSLDAHGVPPELAALPHVESSFNPAAYSRVGAAGLWQFTRSTGRLFLRVDSVIDERMDPFAASDGAARLLRSNYNMLGSWPLAITAYNHGAGGMKRAMSMLGTDDIAVIIAKYKSRSFGFASRNFYTEFLAALDVDRGAERYFGPLTTHQPVRYETAVLEQFMSAEAIERALGIDREILREHNRALRPAAWNGTKYIPKGFELRVPADRLAQPLDVALASIPSAQRFVQQHRDRLYTVHRGDSLSKIARTYGVKEEELMALNSLRSRHRIRAGQVLALPDGPGSQAPVDVARAEPPADGVYHVRRGDTISRIATRFGLTESKLVALNGLHNRHQIAVGQRLLVSTGDATQVSIAAVEPKLEAAAPPPKPPGSTSPTSAIAADTRPVAVAANSEIVESLEIDTHAEAVDPLEIAAHAEGEDSSGIDADTEVADALEIDAEDAQILLMDDLASETPGSASVVVPAPDPSDYAISDDDQIIVQANETLGHYADWLEISTSRLRRLNGIRAGTTVGIGRPTKLDLSVVTRETFEQRRLEYHHTLQEEFFNAYEVVGTDSHKLERGDTLWYLAEKRYRVPLWLLRQYNPTLDFSALQAGARLVVPVLSPRES